MVHLSLQFPDKVSLKMQKTFQVLYSWKPKGDTKAAESDITKAQLDK